MQSELKIILLTIIYGHLVMSPTLEAKRILFIVAR